MLFQSQGDLLSQERPGLTGEPAPVRTLHVTTVDLTAYCFLRSWFRFLRGQGCAVHLATTVTTFDEPLSEVVDELIHLPIERRIRPASDLVSLVRLVALMRRLKPDVVHTHTSKAGFLGRLAARLAGVPLVLHTIHELPQNSTGRPLVQGFYAALERLAAALSHHLITVSYANERQILSEGICAANRLTTIREGLNLEDYRPARPPAEVRAELGIPEGVPVIGMAARLERPKGHPYLLQAFARVLERYPDCRLVCIGTGHLDRQLQALTREMGLQSRVIWTGWVDDLVSTIYSLDVFVLSSLWEGLGIVLLEAMALERPVVSSAVGGTTDVVVDGLTGYLVAPRDPAALSEGILALLDSPEQARNFGKAGRMRVEREFLAEDADWQMWALYTRLWAGRTSRRP